MERNVDAIEHAEIAPLIGRLETLKARLFARLTRPAEAPQPMAEAGSARDLMTVAELAAELQKSEDWVYTHAKKLPFGMKIGRQIRFSRRGLEKWKESLRRRP
jgi:excisionase family DNA binding protein